MPRRQRGRLRRLGRNGGRIGRLHNLGRADSDRLSAHLLKERNDRQNLIFGQTDRILVDVRHPRRDIPSAAPHDGNQDKRMPVAASDFRR